MAPIRAVSFPLSRVEEATRLPLFAVNKADASELESCEAFQIIRHLLANEQGSE